MANQHLTPAQIDLLRELSMGLVTRGLEGSRLLDFAALLRLSYVELRGDHFDVTTTGEQQLLREDRKLPR